MTASHLRRAWRCRPLWFAAMLRRFGIPWRPHHRRAVLRYWSTPPPSGRLFGFATLEVDEATFRDHVEIDRLIDDTCGEEPSDGDGD